MFFFQIKHLPFIVHGVFKTSKNVKRITTPPHPPVRPLLPPSRFRYPPLHQSGYMHPQACYRDIRQDDATGRADGHARATRSHAWVNAQARLVHVHPAHTHARLWPRPVTSVFARARTSLPRASASLSTHARVLFVRVCARARAPSRLVHAQPRPREAGWVRVCVLRVGV